jgi:hypothetical protein
VGLGAGLVEFVPGFRGGSGVVAAFHSDATNIAFEEVLMPQVGGFRVLRVH